MLVLGCFFVQYLYTFKTSKLIKEFCEVSLDLFVYHYLFFPTETVSNSVQYSSSFRISYPTSHIPTDGF